MPAMRGRTSRPVVAFFIASSFLVSGPESTALELRQNQTELQDVDALRRDAEEGDADAQYNLGVLYFEGQGVPEDRSETIRWFRLAADQGHAGAQYALGVSYREGEGVPEDISPRPSGDSGWRPTRASPPRSTTSGRCMARVWASPRISPRPSGGTISQPNKVTPMHSTTSCFLTPTVQASLRTS